MLVAERLYPELVPEEIAEVIDTVDVSGLAAGATKSPPLLIREDAAPEDFGAQAEPYAFARVAAAAARAAWSSWWDDRLDDLLSAPGAFAARARDVLANDFLGLMIRSLVDDMGPRPGHDPESGYRHYCRDLLADGMTELLGRHPVADRRLRIRLRRRVAALAETVARVEADRDDLARELGLDRGVRLEDVALAGDTHAGGRTVSTLTFSDGSRLVYKPRPVAAEAAYAQLCSVLNREIGCHLLAARVLEKQGYGYVEFVSRHDDGPGDLARVGELAAVLYVLNARDMHFTNVLSTSRGPVPVDLETLLHPPRHKARGTVETPRSAYRMLEASVFGTGVLPMVVTRRDRAGYVDVGYLGGGEVRAGGPFRRFAVARPFRTDMQVVWEPAAEDARREEVGPEASELARAACAAMVDGFSATYRLLSERRALVETEVERLFRDAELRYIHNSTVQYDQSLRILTGSGPSADPALARGLARRIGIASRDADPRLPASECAQFWDTDVPFFLVRADGREITDGSSQRNVVAQLDKSPLDHVRDRLRSLSESDLAFQVRLIRTAFHAKLPDPHTMTDAGRYLERPGGVRRRGRGGRAALRDAAAAAGSLLVREMVEDRYPHLPRTWIGPVATADSNRPWPPGVLGYDLYGGRLGPALALSALAAALHDDSFAEAADEVLAPSADILAGGRYELRSIAQAGTGAYGGFAGTLWGMAAAGHLLGRPDLCAVAREARRFISPTTPDRDESWYDVVSGGVGALLVGQVLADDPGVVAAAEAASARALEVGLVRRLPSSGLAHGVAGVLWLAARSARCRPTAAATDLVEAAQRELRDSFTASTGARRTSRSGAENTSDSWCNGTAGLLVAQSEAVRAGLLGDEELVAEVDRLRQGLLSTSLNLCHGVLGLHEVLGALPGKAAEPALRLRAELEQHLDGDLLAAGLTDHRSRYALSPGLMVGRAGVAWHLAGRLLADRPSSPLLLEPPVPGAGVIA